MTEFCTVYVTVGSEAQALEIARTVVNENLAACANLLGPVTSVYRWQGKTHEDAEVALLLKTRRVLFDALAERIRTLHSYDCPCIVAWPLEAGTADYLGWVRDQTRR
ncbi:MAG: divalent-cation tolerance protein CutA [Alphaproteobacteria bacterium]|nr:MAG: divalent-cation tolerance protein CutA [Alphaproteobacteria bacterium]